MLITMAMSTQIISIKEARRLLGNKADSMSDIEVEDIISQLDFIATMAVKDYKLSQIKEKYNGSDC